MKKPKSTLRASRIRNTVFLALVLIVVIFLWGGGGRSKASKKYPSTSTETKIKNVAHKSSSAVNKNGDYKDLKKGSRNTPKIPLLQQDQQEERKSEDLTAVKAANESIGTSKDSQLGGKGDTDFNTSLPYLKKETRCEALSNLTAAVMSAPRWSTVLAGIVHPYMSRASVRLVLELGAEHIMSTLVLLNIFQGGKLIMDRGDLNKNGVNTQRETRVFTVDASVPKNTEGVYAAYRDCFDLSLDEARCTERRALQGALLSDLRGEKRGGGRGESTSGSKSGHISIDLLVVHSTSGVALRANAISRLIRKFILLHEVREPDTDEGTVARARRQHFRAVRTFLLTGGGGGGADWVVETFYEDPEGDSFMLLRRKKWKQNCKSLPPQQRGGRNVKVKNSAIVDLESEMKLISLQPSRTLRTIECWMSLENAISAHLQENSGGQPLPPTQQLSSSLYCEPSFSEPQYRTKGMLQLAHYISYLHPESSLSLRFLPLIVAQTLSASSGTENQVVFWGCRDHAPLLFNLLFLLVSELRPELSLLEYCDKSSSNKANTDTSIFKADVWVVSGETLADAKESFLTEPAVLGVKKWVIYDAGLADISSALLLLDEPYSVQTLSCFPEGNGFIVLSSKDHPILSSYEVNTKDIRKPVEMRAPPPPPENVNCSSFKSSVLCPLQGCWRNVRGEKCTKNPFHHPPTTFDYEGQCVFRSSTGDPRPSLPENRAANQLQNLQHYGSWLFQRYFAFESQCLSVQNPTMTAQHDPMTQLYKLENFCVRPMGPLSGVHPQVQPYRGEDDVFFVNVGPFLQEFRGWLQNVAPLDQTPSCFYDTNVVLFPIGARVDNPGHMFHRAGSLMRLIQTAFPRNANVTIIYVVMNEGVDIVSTKNARLNVNAARFFYQTLSAYHLSVLGFEGSLKQAKRITGMNNLRKLDMETPACFRVGYAWYNMLNENRKFPSSKTPGRQLQFSLFGPRSLRDRETMSLLTSKLFSCFGVSQRRVVSSEHPHVLFCSRSLTRTFPNEGDIVKDLAQVVSQDHGTIETFEDSELSIEEKARRYAGTDIIIGMYGTGLFWHVFAPPGAVVIEINFAGKGFSLHTGLNMEATTDYGGNTFVSRCHHFVYHAPNVLRRLPPGGWEYTYHHDRVHERTNLDMPIVVVIELYKLAMCLVRRKHTCELNQGTVDKAVNAHLEDPKGEWLTATISSFHIPPWLSFKTLEHHEVELAGVFRRYRKGEWLRFLEVSASMCSPDDLSGGGYFSVLTQYVPFFLPTIFFLGGEECVPRPRIPLNITQRLVPTLPETRAYYQRHHCQGVLDTPSIRKCAGFGGQFDVIMVEGSALVGRSKSASSSSYASSLQDLFSLLDENGDVVITGLTCENVNALELPESTNSKLQCGEGLAVLHKPKFYDNDLIFYIKGLLEAGENSATNDPMRVPVVGYVIGCKEVEAFKRNVRRLSVPIGMMILVYNCLDQDEAALLANLTVPLFNHRFHVFYQGKGSLMSLPAAYNIILRTGFEHDITATHIILMDPNVEVKRKWFTDFALRSTELGKGEIMTGTLTFCHFPQGQRVYTMTRLAANLAGLFDENLPFFSYFLVEYGLRMLSVGLRPEYLFNLIIEDFNAYMEIPFCSLPFGNTPLRDTIVNVPASRNQKQRWYDPEYYIEKKWGISGVRIRDGQYLEPNSAKETLYLSPFAFSPLSHHEDLGRDEGYLHCLHSGVGTKNTCEKCIADVISMIRGNEQIANTITNVDEARLGKVEPYCGREIQYDELGM